ncbi:lipopolysaccharide assembly LapA domain-containing protein [Gordonia sp. (in: high G+C Gram-positive bacteria)]|uniref:LapA family protein n=1 Tax=Gordonia sp. (in: high G+C Gram-positive bacteria) TaxID=84139 RepID=UPI0016A42605|nr:lipopolysaccharide assembly protein LapA domain-containing protein [Gordonia sp. (in: high G+C Gram-positive bacteria)]NLG45615.1 DUF1049 domain-containing protein [Gordonia sp. (in: high G+C Gram-positive bacteria)]
MTTPDPQDGADLPEIPATESADTAATSHAGAGERLHEEIDEERRRLRKAVEDVSRTRTRATYVAWVVGVIAMILLLVFIVANLENVEVNVLFGKIDLPVGVAMLVAAIIGSLITAALGGARILQLNRVVKQAGKQQS